MRKFKAPLIVTDDSGSAGTIIGPQIVAMGGNPAGIIQANALFLYGGAGVDVGPQRLSLFGEPGIIEVNGDDSSRIRLEAGGRLTISDNNENQRVVVDATGTVTVSDADGSFSVVISPGGVNLLNTSPGFSSSIVFETAGRITIADAVGNTALYSAAGWTVNGSGGCAINGGNLSVTGNVTVQGDINLPGADCAEDFNVVDARALDAGTVVVIDQTGSLAESTEAYDRKVAGIVSGAGRYRPGIILDRREVPDGVMPDVCAPVALIGKVCCKATAPIAVGDLLTTSSVPGHAMRADDPSRAFGAILGKALEALPSGTGLITVLVTLQ